MVNKMTDLNRIAAFIASHDPEMMRIVGDHIEVSTTVVYPDRALCCTMPEEIRTVREARDWLGY